jgi:multiple sugar transport system ATP-binding protein
MAEVILREISKRFGGAAPAVDGVDLQVRDREFMVLVGPSGCGKSTLLRIIAGLEDPDAGEIWIGGQRMNDVPPKDRNIAMVFQDYALYPHMTAYENMAFSLRLRKRPRAEIQQRVEEAAGLLGLSDLLGRKPKDLSGGERQRVAVGRAIVRQPQVFLFDEPLSNLDARLRGEMRAELQKLHRRLDTTMIYVTHDQMEAMTMGNRIAVLRAGRLQQTADPLTLYHRPCNRFVAGFIGSPPMNQVEGVLAGESEIVFEGQGLRVPMGSRGTGLGEWRGRRVVLGLRSEDLRPAGSGQADVQLETRVEVVEPLGSETLLVVLAGSVQLTARLPADRLPQVGESLALAFDSARAHLFSAEDGEALPEAEA